METLLPNVNTSEGCFEIGVNISNPVFTEDAINKRKHEQELLNKICILSMLARLRPIQKDAGNEYSICTCSDSFLVSGEPVDIAVSVHRTMQECVTAATEQKIPGNCYPVDKVIHQDNNEIPAGL